MTFRMSRVMACVAFAALVGCETDAPPSEVRDTYRLIVGGEDVDQSDGKTFSPAEVEGALRRGVLIRSLAPMILRFIKLL